VSVQSSSLLVARLEAIRREIAQSDEISHEHKDALQARIDEAQRTASLFQNDEMPQTELVAALRSLSDSVAEIIAQAVRSDLRAASKLRSVVYEAVREAVAVAMGEAIEAHESRCPYVNRTAAEKTAAEPGTNGRRRRGEWRAADLEGMRWQTVAKLAALNAPAAFFGVVFVVVVYLLFTGFGPRFMDIIAGG